MASGSRSRSGSAPVILESDETLLDLYKRWMSHCEVSRSRKQQKKRFVAFKENVKYVHMENKMDKPYKLGLNTFSDWTLEEFESKYMGSHSPEEMIKMYDMIQKMGGLLSEEDYRLRKMDGPRVNMDGYSVVPPGDEEAIRAAVCKHPVSALIDSQGDAFKNYREGVLTVEAGKEKTHAVCLVGFGKTPDGLKYWIVMNSWGQKWGDGGYMNLQRGVNLCGIASFVSHPNLAI